MDRDAIQRAADYGIEELTNARSGIGDDDVAADRRRRDLDFAMMLLANAGDVYESLMVLTRAQTRIRPPHQHRINTAVARAKDTLRRVQGDLDGHQDL